jgi:hypothetical protein
MPYEDMNLRELELCAVDNFGPGDNRHRKPGAPKGLWLAGRMDKIQPGAGWLSSRAMAAALRCNAMPPLAQTLAPWHDFYALPGTASATMVGLLFVAASVAGGVFAQNRSGALRIFLSASVVHFSSILATCLMVLAPVRWWELLGGMNPGWRGLRPGLFEHRLARHGA